MLLDMMRDLPKVPTAKEALTMIDGTRAPPVGGTGR